MATKSPPLSITLPRNFTFHYTDSDTPQTPAHNTAAHTHNSDLPPQPPVIPRAGFKIRRRKRINDVPQWSSAKNDYDALDPMPSIEMTEASDHSSPAAKPAAYTSRKHLAPQPKSPSNIPPPRTPVSQSIAPYDKLADEWALINRDLPMRPISACSNSNFSESSISSAASSSQTFPSLGGSCTSPDLDPLDPFLEPDIKSSSTVPAPSSPSLVKKRRKAQLAAAKWTSELDHHLWLTYMKYVQDPTVTPFKMLPGVVPPLGVCHRVARQAKRTWTDRPRSIALPSVEDSRDRRPAPALWPSSESSTRRRLRDLCKRKPSLSAHYQRLLKARSASPFTSSSSPGRESSSGPIGPPDLCAGRHNSDPLTTPVGPGPSSGLNRSSTADLVPPGPEQSAGPFDSFSLDAPFPPLPEIRRPPTWGPRTGGRSRAHQKSQSLQLELGLGLAPRSQASENEAKPVLASPFSFSGNTRATKSLGRSFASNGGGAPVLQSPFDTQPVAGPSSSSTRPLKRAHVAEAGTPYNLRSMFARPNLPPASTPRPTRAIRDRAFSLGAVRAGVSDIAASFVPPPLPPLPALSNLVTDVPMQDAQDQGQSSDGSHLQAPQPSVRLGSPFSAADARSTGNNSNTFPRHYGARHSIIGRQNHFDPA